VGDVSNLLATLLIWLLLIAVAVMLTLAVFWFDAMLSGGAA
jgi:hypothetical protein